MKATIYDVAKEAEVSIATVSKVINQTGRISHSTRGKVLQVMKKMNYHPSFVATALTGKRTETLGLLVPDISNPFFSEIAKTIENHAHDKGKSVIICSTNYKQEKETKYIELLQRKQIDGLIITSGFQNKDLLQQMITSKIPVIILAHNDPSLNISVVSVDDFKGGFMATSHLLSKGHSNIAIIAEEVKSSTIRILGYEKAYESKNIKPDRGNILRTTASIENGKRIILDLLSRKIPPTAVFACNDLIAIGVIQGAREKGLNIPDDLSVIGFDNTILATTTVPALTTIAQPIEDMGEKVVDVIIDEIEKGSETSKKRILFIPELIVRGTTSDLKDTKD
ncbi:LacI family DNA-binding transcriptional regulator [Virgibacillus litoralis]|uniref:DNA-binding LacI/PurR family transcriptional regulator n=1 Tax=Virgibacillus litoralis TaxID=578221 RepID=A0ABS4HAF2_9BACI|nr:LacI family DNA-binding transcriptional regulator [Virgibacillus litoralis]MBP1947886.1 DNA-binding LacI/PurR family transcriptional regulator [Virgibacillus litoralis]